MSSASLPPAAVASPPTWAHLVRDAGFPDFSIGKVLAALHRETPIRDVLQVLLQAKTLAEADPAVDSQLTLAQYAASFEPVYLLCVPLESKKVSVFHSISYCPAMGLQAGASRVAGLLGERTEFLPPILVRTSGQIAQQHSIFGTVENLRLKTTTAIRTYLARNPAETFCSQDEAPAQEEGEEVEVADITTTVPRLMPVHAKWACLFLEPRTPLEALRLGAQLQLTVPDLERGQTEILMTWLRAAASKGDGDASAVQVNLTREDAQASPQLRAWYNQILAHKIPKLPKYTSEPSRELAATVPATAPVTATETKEYLEHELKNLAWACGTEGPSDAVTTAALPVFWRKFLDVRTKKVETCREFVESYLEERRPTGIIQVAYVVTTDFIKTLKAVSFVGNDRSVSFSQRHKGFSLFTVEPCESLAEAEERRAFMIQYEQTQSNSTPEDMAKAEELYKARSSLPGTLERQVQWIQHFRWVVETFLGAGCELYDKCLQIQEVLHMQRRFLGWRPLDFQALTWAIHDAVRTFFIDKDSEALERIAMDLRHGYKVGRDRLPIELLPPPAPPVGMQPPPPPGQPALPARKIPKVAEENTRPYMSGILVEIRRAQAHAKTNLGRTFRISYLFGSGSPYKDIGELLPAGFPLKREANKAPCARLVIGGECPDGQRCAHQHTFTSDVHRGVGEELRDRVRRTVDHWIREHPKADGE